MALCLLQRRLLNARLLGKQLKLPAKGILSQTVIL